METQEFRAWDFTHEKMITENVCAFAPSPKVVIDLPTLFGVVKDFKIIPLYNCVGMQSTNHLDLKGKKIFAGDFIKRKNAPMEEIWHIKQSNFISDTYWIGQYMIQGDQYEIVGNEFENPELLEKINKNLNE